MHTHAINPTEVSAIDAVIEQRAGTVYRIDKSDYWASWTPHHGQSFDGFRYKFGTLEPATPRPEL